MCVCLRLCLFVCMSECVCVSLHACMGLCVCAFVCGRVAVCVFVCVWLILIECFFFSTNSLFAYSYLDVFLHFVQDLVQIRFLFVVYKLPPYFYE